MRINKYLAFKKISTRLGADELVKNKKVFINGKLAVLGSKVNEKDVVEVKGAQSKKYLYFAYNKPIGIETSSPTEELFPVGRLDKASHGLLILTNDGRIVDRLLNPKFYHEKEYIIKTFHALPNNFKQRMERGVNIEGYVTKECKVTMINKFTFKIVLTEGKKHQIRRMCSALHQEVKDLKRTRVMNIELGDLKAGSMRDIKGKELSTFLDQVLHQS